MFDVLVNGFVTLFVILDPLALVPLFLALTAGASVAERRRTALRASIIAGCILALFGLAGLAVLSGLGITLGAFRVAGGLFLFFIGFELVFERRGERKAKSAQGAAEEPEADIAAFPLAIPLLAGPGAISATILLSGSLPTLAGKAGLLLVITVAAAISFVVLAEAHRIDRFLGPTSRAVISRLLGVLLAALAVQFIADGVAQLTGSSGQIVASH
ncbi:MarC family protein [Mangrovibrevibacter kandeliae]|uniref:MarC family protein n=1 Tax=Mangrovibrevibacter kandeliae TaxID=2968473 RepID=UPI00211976F8|nr:MULTISPECIES: MarC family protein [unclassified Aurantimonas]MCQ8782650.1 MarC family protein [Aurantimonas sp. CSK15Z-1]MCW4114541.1 MarC family protein [Aurantimonas sp. MSK8Z-1]